MARPVVLIIESDLIPTKFSPVIVAIPAWFTVISVLIVYLVFAGVRTVSDQNEVAKPLVVPLPPPWYIDLTSSIVNSCISLIDTDLSVDPLIDICSPIENDPEVWLTTYLFDPLPTELLELSLYAVAPLLKPLI